MNTVPKDETRSHSRRIVMIVGCFGLCIILSPVIYVVGSSMFIMLNWAYRDIPRSGEHLPKAEEYSPHATNYSYYSVFLNQACEFDIPEDAFLEMCRLKKFHDPVRIETLAGLPPLDNDDVWPHVNESREVPVVIRWYVWHEADHENCVPVAYGECKVDPTHKTGASCLHAVSQGYYYEIRGADAGGTKVVYDSENGRCYIHSNPH